MYIVKTGDNLLSIAKKRAGLPYKICGAGSFSNKLESTIIYPGQVLRFTKSQTSNKVLINDRYHIDTIKREVKLCTL